METTATATAAAATVGREAAYAEAAKFNSRDGSSAVWRQPFPTRYTSDPDVIPRSRQSGSDGYSLIDDPAETLKVKALASSGPRWQAQWAAYFRAMNAALVQYPYTEEELARRAKATEVG